jgi:hypothetical protein
MMPLALLSLCLGSPNDVARVGRQPHSEERHRGRNDGSDSDPESFLQPESLPFDRERPVNDDVKRPQKHIEQYHMQHFDAGW